MSRSSPKTTLIVILDFRGIVHREFVPQGQTVNTKFYCEFLRRLRENIRRKRPDLWREELDSSRRQCTLSPSTPRS
jgi:hypothetical protein